MVSYPLLLKRLLQSNSINVRNYTFAKFERLNYFLCKNKNI